MNRQTLWPLLVAVVGIALLVPVMDSRSLDVWADPKEYVFTPLGFLGETTPGGQQFLEVFDSSRINNRGNVLFGSNVTADDAGGLFLLRSGRDRRFQHASVNPPQAVASSASAPCYLPPSTTRATQVLSGCSTPSVISIPKNVPAA